MHTWIRLADRQGLLTGRGLSTTQVRAVFFREVETSMELRETHKQQFLQSLVPMAAVGRVQIGELFPDVFGAVAPMSSVPGSPAGGPVVTDDNLDLPDDEDAVIYRFGEIDMTPEEIERELAVLMAGGEMTVNGAEIADGPA